jgi:hypothetical protein
MSTYEIESRAKLAEEENKTLSPELMALEREGKNGDWLNKWPKERLLHFLGNRFYNNVSNITESPEILLDSPDMRQECDFYLSALDLMEVPREEILTYLRGAHEQQLAQVEEYRRRKEREKTFKDKVDELSARFKQLTIEFTDGTTLPVNILSLHLGPFYGTGSEKEHVECSVKAILSDVVAELLGFDRWGRPSARALPEVIR